MVPHCRPDRHILHRLAQRDPPRTTAATDATVAIGTTDTADATGTTDVPAALDDVRY
jgi:hypothetical protein